MKLCANASFFGGRKDRFNQYQPNRTVREKFELIAGVDGISGVELKYPFDFVDKPLVHDLLTQHDLSLAAVNVDLKDIRHFRHGALSARDRDARDTAVSRLNEGMECAMEFGTGLVSTCPLADGYDYPFQLNHAVAWDNFVDSVRRAASYRPECRLALEYQPHEPHARIMLSNVGKALHVCDRVGLPNVGVNLDVGHSLAAGEFPAEAASLLLRANRLFYIHSNDNTGEGGDWDMISGAVHPWQWVELFHVLARESYQGWIGGDIQPKHWQPEQGYRANSGFLTAMHLFESRHHEQLASLLEHDGNTPMVMELLQRTFEV